MIIGIDNGLDGGLCALSRFNGSVISYRPMPCYKRKGKREIDVVAVYRWVEDFHTELLVAVEEPLKHARSSQAVRSMGISFGQLIAMCRLKGIPFVPVDVHDWQKKMLGLVPKGQTKAYALKAVKELWPDEEWLATERSSVAHDGIVDAALLAKYALTCNLKP